MTFGNYFIGQRFSEITNEMTEISKAEYSVLKTSFPDEKIYHGKQIEICENFWSSVIGVTQEKVYKISLQTQTTQKSFEISEDRLWNKVFQKLNTDFEIFKDQEKIGETFSTTWDTKLGNIILNSTTLPNENILPVTSELILDITATGNFAFSGANKGRQVGMLIFFLVGIVISQFVSSTIALIIFVLLGLMLGRKIDQFLGKLFLKSIIKKGYVVFISLLWGVIIAFGIKELILLYDPNMFLKIVCYSAGIYLSYVFYQDSKINTMAEVTYGKNITSVVNSAVIITNILCSLAFNYLLK